MHFPGQPGLYEFLHFDILVSKAKYLSAQFVSMGSFDHSQWYQCDCCGWYGYFGPDVPDKYALYDIDGCTLTLLCTWCFERSLRCDWHDKATRCDSCGWVGYNAGIGKMPNDLAVLDLPGFGKICYYCISRDEDDEDDGDNTDAN